MPSWGEAVGARTGRPACEAVGARTGRPAGGEVPACEAVGACTGRPAGGKMPVGAPCGHFTLQTAIAQRLLIHGSNVLCTEGKEAL
jgi:hypothetical protein